MYTNTSLQDDNYNDLITHSVYVEKKSLSCKYETPRGLQNLSGSFDRILLVYDVSQLTYY